MEYLYINHIAIINTFHIEDDDLCTESLINRSREQVYVQLTPKSHSHGGYGANGPYKVPPKFRQSTGWLESSAYFHHTLNRSTYT